VTVLAWHRRGFRLFWTWKSGHRSGSGGLTRNPCADSRDVDRESSVGRAADCLSGGEERPLVVLFNQRPVRLPWGSHFAADPIIHDPVSSRTPARLVLIETRELAWHRAKYRAAQYLCAPADPMLVSLRTLQFWLWQRLQAPLADGVPA
jgi:hypothetical protein